MHARTKRLGNQGAGDSARRGRGLLRGNCGIFVRIVDDRFRRMARGVSTIFPSPLQLKPGSFESRPEHRIQGTSARSRSREASRKSLHRMRHARCFTAQSRAHWHARSASHDRPKLKLSNRAADDGEIAIFFLLRGSTRKPSSFPFDRTSKARKFLKTLLRTFHRNCYPVAFSDGTESSSHSKPLLSRLPSPRAPALARRTRGL